ncbi:MAG: hypothetical protein Q9169_006259, partial [Polycauliona sp. 2 TL-2023]
ESWFNQTVKGATRASTSSGHVQWADSVESAIEEDDEYSDNDSDSDDEMEQIPQIPVRRLRQETAPAPIVTVEEDSDEEMTDDEEDEELSLTRTHSNQPPELLHESDSESDEDMPPSPPQPEFPLDAFSQKQRQAIATTGFYQPKQEAITSTEDHASFFEDGATSCWLANMPSPSPTSTPSPRSASRAPPQPPITSSPHSPASLDILGLENADPKTVPFRPKLAFAGATGSDGRRPSVQFAPAARTGDQSCASLPKPTGSPKARLPMIQRRLSSPPPPSKYERRVSFNTFDNRDATDYSFHIATKHKDYQYTQRSRTFLCGTDDNDYSYDAIEWLIEELVEDGDEIICLRVVDKDSRFASDASLRNGTYKKEAEQLLEKIKNKNKDREDEKEKAIGLAIEFAVGKVPEVFQRMISVYAPACLIVGTKGKSPGGMSSFVTGSVSRYCLQNSPVPCIVVRPNKKRLAKKSKRLADEKRRNYQGVLRLSGARGSTQALQTNNNHSDMEGTAGGATEKEAQAVAAAIGIPRSLSRLEGLRKPTPGPEDESAPLVRTHSGNTNTTSVGNDSPSPTGAYMVSGGNSPDLEPLDDDSLPVSDAEEEENENVGDKSKSEEARGRQRATSLDEGGEGGKRKGAKTFVFPEKKRKGSGG